MATITPPDYAKTAGIPSQSSDNINVTPEGLITGDFPKVFTEDMTFAINQNIPAYTPLGLDASGDLIPAVLGTTAAIAISFFDIVTGAAPKVGAPVYRGGVFNPAMLKWHASYDTDEKKLEAFRAAPSPSQIVIRPVKTATVVLP